MRHAATSLGAAVVVALGVMAGLTGCSAALSDHDLSASVDVTQPKSVRVDDEIDVTGTAKLASDSAGKVRIQLEESVNGRPWAPVAWSFSAILTPDQSRAITVAVPVVPASIARFRTVVVAASSSSVSATSKIVSVSWRR